MLQLAPNTPTFGMTTTYRQRPPAGRTRDRMTHVTDRTARLRDALKQCAAENDDGLVQILNIEGPQLLGLATRILGRRDLAEDALQDAMVQIWRKAQQFSDTSGSARGWIYAIVRNRCLNILRDGKRLSLMSPEDLATVQEARQSIEPTQDWEILASGSKLQNCLRGLDDKNREAILLAYVGGYSHGEIAAKQDVPLGTTKSWIRRGLTSLKECLA
ncbi:RNA polymerase sigma-70 factor, ECF subfamily [Loktanella sp. DSM 29012]|nr:RNA polymerase sigma-70 factor, ECF subfamily [Loktanella sp. DSM 29012]